MSGKRVLVAVALVMSACDIGMGSSVAVSEDAKRAADAAVAAAAAARTAEMGAVAARYRAEAALTTVSPTGNAQTSAAPDALSVLDFGAVCDGVADDTAAVSAAITAAAGRELRFPPGTCVVNTITIASAASFSLAEGAVIRHRSGSSDHMFIFTGSRLRIHGGTIDGNRLGQGANRRYAMRLSVPTGTIVEFDRVAFTGTAAAGVYVKSFGGQMSVTRCSFVDMAEHDGVPGHWTAAVYVETGQAGAKGLLRFNHNTLIGTNAPVLAGGSPGGLFFAPTMDYGGGVGNFSTLEAIGNYFWGIGQHCSVNDIAPIHTYPATDGARVIGNYFEQSGFSAIAAKSVQNFVCTGNVILNGQTSDKNVATEGAISYAPGYHSGATARPRAVISGNVVDTPGGQPTVKQDCIAVLGTPTSIASDVVIADNVLAGCGNGIQVAYAQDVSIQGNKVNGSTGGLAGRELGIRIAQVTGTVKISGNHIRVPNGHGIYAIAGVNASRFILDNNYVDHDAPATYGIVLRGVALAKFTGNLIDSATAAISVAGDGTNSVGRFYWDTSNVILAGSVGLNFSQIALSGGHLAHSSNPEGLVASPPGTLYTRTSASAPVLYVKESGSGNTGWVAK